MLGAMTDAARNITSFWRAAVPLPVLSPRQRGYGEEGGEHGLRRRE
jgi:hypothetical protein